VARMGLRADSLPSFEDLGGLSEAKLHRRYDLSDKPGGETSQHYATTKGS